MLNCEYRPQRRGSRQEWKHLLKGWNGRIRKQEATREPGCSAISGGVVLLKLHFLWCWCAFSCKASELTFSVVSVPFLMQNLSEASCSGKARSVKVSREMLKLGDMCGQRT